MRLKLNQHWFRWEEITRIDTLEQLAGWSMLNDYERNTLIFCQEWLTGKKSFTLHTSGSTGSPKPITIARSQMQASARMTAKALGLEKGDSALVCLNTAYIAGKMMLVRGFEVGMVMTIITPQANPLADFSIAEHFHFTALVPMQLKTMLEETPEKLSILQGMKAIIVGGGPVDKTLENALQTINAPIYSTYGMTETVSHIALRRLNGAEASGQYQVLNDIEIGTDTRGCLTIKGRVTGYQELVTNDIVTITDPKHFLWLGRIDNVINTGGVKVHPESIEALIEKLFMQMHIQRRFFVAGLADERLGESVILIIEGKALGRDIENTLLHSMSKELHPYAIPKSIYYLPAFYLTPTYKIARKINLEILLARLHS
jgi:o-succinylbenzoate---CoA ligase